MYSVPEKNTKIRGSSYESMATCVTTATATCLLKYGKDKIDEYASLQLAGLSVYETIA